MLARRIFLSLTSLIALGIIIFGLHTLSNSRTYQTFGDLAARVETDRPVIALTFDDGPTAGFTTEVLEILDELGVTATFFVTGKEVNENPDETRAIVAAGHELGNHSYSHRCNAEGDDLAIQGLLPTSDYEMRPPLAEISLAKRLCQTRVLEIPTDL